MNSNYYYVTYKSYFERLELLTKTDSSTFNYNNMTNCSFLKLVDTVLQDKTNEFKRKNNRVKLLEYLEKCRGFVSYDELKSLDIMSIEKAKEFVSFFELARRFYAPAKRRIDSALDVYNLLKFRVDDSFEENMYVLTVNGAQELINLHHAGKGSINNVIINPREVFNYAILDRAVAVIIAHNHPSGNVRPSDKDSGVNQRIISAGKILGIPLIDHIIFSTTAYYSFLENNDF